MKENLNGNLLGHKVARILGEKRSWRWCWGVVVCDDDDGAWEMSGLLVGARMDLNFAHVSCCLLHRIVGVGEDQAFTHMMGIV